MAVEHGEELAPTGKTTGMALGCVPAKCQTRLCTGFNEDGSNSRSLIVLP
jgi:hypothetical protein